MSNDVSNELTRQVDRTLADYDPKSIEGRFRKAELPLPRAMRSCPGISLFGRLIKSLVFSTDLAVIRNCDADAVLAVYPFTCQPAITQGLLNLAERPVFTGVSGSLTTGLRSVELAMQSEMQGASGVVVNMATPPEVIASIARSVDIPVVVTLDEVSDRTLEQIASGARILNVAAGARTPDVVREFRALFADMPIMASSGRTEESAAATIEAGADALTWTPPNLQELERANMAKNRRARDMADAPIDARLVASPEENVWGDEAAQDVDPNERILTAAVHAADAIANLDPAERQRAVMERAHSTIDAFAEKLDEDERLLFKRLLFKLFDGPLDDDSVARADEGAAGLS